MENTANNNPSGAATHVKVNQPSSTSEEGIQLRYPTIDLATSSDSVLSPSSNASTVMPPANDPVQALDESWASLDTSDFGHEEDLQSENTDAESLVDLSSAQDTESVVDDDEHDEHGHEETLQDNTTTTQNGKPFQPSPHPHSPQDTQFEEDADDTIIFQACEEQQSLKWSQIEHTCDMLPISVSSTGLRETIEKQTLHMKVSKQRLQPMKKPFHIAYYGVGSARISRDELLGKIGAALVTSIPYQNSSKCYNIFPTEFGPGSKPAFAELIPSQAQMIVDDITVLKHGPDRPDSIRFALKQGKIFESNTALPTTGLGKAPWRPNLVVVHLCRDDLADDLYTAQQVTEVAERHCWPLLLVTQDSAAGMYPPCSRDLNKEFVAEKANCSNIVAQPIDLDTFLRIDTDQLNRHIRYVVEEAEASLQSLDSPSTFIECIKALAYRVYGLSSGSTAQANGYVLEVVQPSPTGEVQQQTLKIYKDKALQIFSEAVRSSSLQNLAVSLAITALFFLIMANCQMLLQSTYRVFRTSQQMSLRHSINPVTTVTATSAISTIVHSPTTIVYENTMSKGLDQMLQRLMGKFETEAAPILEDLAQDGSKQETNSDDEGKSLHSDTHDTVMSGFESFLSRILIELEVARKRWNETDIKSDDRQQPEREHPHYKLRDFQIRVKRLSNELSERSRELSQQSLLSFAKLFAAPQAKFTELLDRSQIFMKKSRQGAVEQIDKFVEDQKSVLRSAQRQAQQLIGQPKDAVKQDTTMEDTKKSTPRKAIRNLIPFI